MIPCKDNPVTDCLNISTRKAIPHPTSFIIFIIVGFQALCCFKAVLFSCQHCQHPKGWDHPWVRPKPLEPLALRHQNSSWHGNSLAPSNHPFLLGKIIPNMVGSKKMCLKTPIFAMCIEPWTQTCHVFHYTALVFVIQVSWYCALSVCASQIQTSYCCALNQLHTTSFGQRKHATQS